MRQVPNSKRSRGRNGRKPHSGGSPKNQTFDSSGPDVKVRGSASQVLEKYLALARDASASGDRIAAENYFQHAEHYYRILNAQAQQFGRPQQAGFAGGPNGFGGPAAPRATPADPGVGAFPGPEEGEAQPMQPDTPQP
jgi:hypothetical protein